MTYSGKLWRIAALVGLAIGSLLSASAPAAEIGDKIDGFSLPDIHGKERALTDLSDKQVVVVAFLGVDCPLARLYAPRLEELREKYSEQGVALIAIDANSQDSLADMTAFVNGNELKYSFLKDRDQAVADKFGVVRNPEVFVLDRERKIRYRGRIDDQYGLGSSSGYAKTSIKEHNLGDAIDAVLAGKSVATPVVAAMGCLIGRTPKSDPKGEITYTKHIAALMQDKCVSCHRPNQIGPFALSEYEEVAGWGSMIKEVVSEGRMPPWGANPEIGKFSNDCRLDDAEKQMLYAWVDNGCPRGNAADLPPAKQWTEGWGIPKPDQIIKMAKPIHIPAEGVMAYQNITLDPGWTEDKWIAAVECLPGHRSVVHHVIVSVRPPGAQQNRGGLGRLAGLRPGAQGGAGQGAITPEQLERLRAFLPDGAQGGANLEELLRRGSQNGEAQDLGAIARQLQERLAAQGTPSGEPDGARGAADVAAAGNRRTGGGGLTAYVPGTAGEIFPPGTARFVPAGSKINLQIHYTPNGKAVDDVTSLGVVFADPKTVKKFVHGGSASAVAIAIPPHDDNYKVVAESPIRYDQYLLWMAPHMHVRGKSMRFDVTYPDGGKETLLDIPKYDFNWQIHYTLDEPKLLPQGSKITVTAHFDNSEANPSNPDPNKLVRWGLQTWEEMMIGFYSTLSIRDDAVASASE